MRMGIILIIVLSALPGTFLLNNVRADLDITINSKLNGFNSEFRTITNPNASIGYDGFDMIAQTSISNYSRLSSRVGGNFLSVDAWPSSLISREIELTYDSNPRASGILFLSWNFSSSEYNFSLVDYGNDSAKKEVVSIIDMLSKFSYNASADGVHYFSLIVEKHSLSNESASEDTPAICDEEDICAAWNVCQNVKSSFLAGAINSDDYNSFTLECGELGFDSDSCGFQIRECSETSECFSFEIIPKVQVCYYSENPSCSDGIKNCHSGDCEILTDCGGPCEPCATCSDGKKNQGEQGIDCGGPCVNECRNDSLKNIFYNSANLIYVYWSILAVLSLFLVILLIKLIKSIIKWRRESLEWYRL